MRQGAWRKSLKYISVNNLKKSFGRHQVLKGVSFEVSKGEVSAIIGPSGCGKSTILRCINGLDKADEGSIKIDGTEIVGLSKKELIVERRNIGMVFQSFNLFVHMNVRQNIGLGMKKVLGYSQDKIDQKTIQLLEQVGLADKIDAFPDQLSGGQKQRIAIARALSMSPKLMLFDEPTSALDPEMVGEVIAVIKKLATMGMTMILVSHEMQFIHEAANHVIFIEDGVVYEQRSPKQVLQSPQEPRTQNFLSRLNLHF